MCRLIILLCVIVNKVSKKTLTGRPTCWKGKTLYRDIMWIHQYVNTVTVNILMSLWSKHDVYVTGYDAVIVYLAELLLACQPCW